jgi:excinuclease UvrABC ATPase subunit
VIAFPVDVPANFTEEEITKLLQAQGYTRIHERNGTRLEVVQDRVKMASAEKARVVEAIEAALRVGTGGCMCSWTMRQALLEVLHRPALRRTATSTTPIPRRRGSRSTRPSARATPAAASGA